MVQQRRVGLVSCLVAVVGGSVLLAGPVGAGPSPGMGTGLTVRPLGLAAVDLVTPGATYVEDFDTLASSGTSSTTPDGWQLAESGTGGNTTYSAGTGSSSTGDTYSFGSSGATDRAFGGLQTGSLVPKVGASFTNLTGGPLSGLEIGYTGEQWRLGTVGRVDRLDFQYSLDATSLNTGTWIDVDSLDFIAPATSGGVGLRNGNLAENRTAISATVGDLNIADGAMFWIRWTDLDAAGSDDGLAVDDFALTPQSTGPTNTPTPTAMSSVAPTDTPTATGTDEPTATPTATNILTPAPTNTDEPTATNTATLTATATPTNTDAATPTATDPPDLDGDGVASAIEDGAPNSGDGNGDSVPDRTQSSVASLPNSSNGDYLTVVGPPGSQLADVAAVANPNPGAPEIGAVTFPAGFVEFRLSPMPAPPTAVTVQIRYQNAVTSNQYWRYGPEPAPGNTGDHWYRFDPVLGSPATGATLISPTRWDLSFVDGARGDDDLTADGTLVDQGGPGNGGNMPVQLARFTAARLGRAVRLEWVTISEIKTAGFRLWRESLAGRLEPIGPSVIAAHGDESSGAAYGFLDRSAPRQRLRYWLEDLSASGQATRHGPAMVPALRARLIGRPNPNPPVAAEKTAVPTGSTSRGSFTVTPPGGVEHPGLPAPLGINLTQRAEWLGSPSRPAVGGRAGVAR